MTMENVAGDCPSWTVVMVVVLPRPPLELGVTRTCWVRGGFCEVGVVCCWGCCPPSMICWMDPGHMDVVCCCCCWEGVEGGVAEITLWVVYMTRGILAIRGVGMRRG